MDSSWQIRSVVAAMTLKLVVFKVRLIQGLRDEKGCEKTNTPKAESPDLQCTGRGLGGWGHPGCDPGTREVARLVAYSGLPSTPAGQSLSHRRSAQRLLWLPALTQHILLLLEARKSYRGAGWPLGPLLRKGISNMTFPISMRLIGTVLVWDEQKTISGSFWFPVDSPCDSQHAVSTDLYLSCVLNMNQNREEKHGACWRRPGPVPSSLEWRKNSGVHRQVWSSKCSTGISAAVLCFFPFNVLQHLTLKYFWLVSYEYIFTTEVYDF